jgi:hydroxyacylglutathione hydrolase
MLEVKSLVFSPIQENTYLLYNERNHGLVVDPGCYFGQEREELKSFIEKYAILPKYLLNTHCHLDHVFGNAFVHQNWNLELHLHELEKPLLDYAPTSGIKWGLPFENYKGNLNYIREGDQIRLDEDVLDVIFAPGHSPGHLCFYNKAQGFVIGGDVLFRQSIGRTDLPGGSLEVLLESIRTKLFTLPDETVVYPGHGPSTTIGYEKRNNPFLNE